MPNSRVREATEQTVMEIRQLGHKHAVEAVKGLKEYKRFIRGTKGRDLKLQVLIEDIGKGTQIISNALLDSGATGSCVNKEFVQKHQLTVRDIPIKMPVYNADGTLNEGGSISGFVEVRMVIGDHAEMINLAVTNLGQTDIFLGLDWLRYHNPSVDWTESTMVFDRCPNKCGYIPYLDSPEHDHVMNRLEEGERVFYFDWDTYVKLRKSHIRSMTPAAQPYLDEFPSVFSAKDFDQLPERRPWDHAIDLTPGATPADCKIYPLNPQEQKALDEFLEENLRTGCIHPSSSQMASPFFFVKKKDGSL